MQKNKYGLRKVSPWLILAGLIFSLAGGYYIAAGMEPGFLIFHWMDKLQNVVLQKPFDNYWNQYSAACMGIALFCYLLALLYYLTTAKNYMRGKEYGTAKFMEAEELSKELADLSTDVMDEKNIVLSYEKRWFKRVYRLERM